MSRMASPELTPGAVPPRISAVGNMLKWPASTGALMSFTFTSVPSGTISPLALRVLRFVTSAGLARNGASACAVTR